MTASNCVAIFMVLTLNAYLTHRWMGKMVTIFQRIYSNLYHISSTIELPGVPFVTPKKHFWFRVFGTLIIYVITALNLRKSFTATGCRYSFKMDSCWPIATASRHGRIASYCDVIMTDCCPVVSMEAFLSQWRWEILKYRSGMPNVSSFIIERICGAVNNGFDHLAAAGQHENYARLLPLN